MGIEGADGKSGDEERSRDEGAHEANRWALDPKVVEVESENRRAPLFAPPRLP